MRKFTAPSLIIATHNKGKLAEFRALLAPFVLGIVSAGDMGLAEPEETGSTFHENAALKALAAARASGEVALADDSGLCVKALNGDPGIFSARWGGPAKDMNLAMSKVNDALGDAPDRSAYFIAVLALAWPDGHVEYVEGRVDGTICWPPRGAKGHGYDPIFVPRGDTRTFAEMDEGEKNAISHRGRALQELVKKLRA